MVLIVGVAFLNSPEGSAVQGVALVSEILALICFWFFVYNTSDNLNYKREGVSHTYTLSRCYRDSETIGLLICAHYMVTDIHFLMA